MLSLFEIILIAFAMSVDAFSVAFGIGCKYHSQGIILDLAGISGFSSL